jgi:hypothetical protein
MSDLIFNISTFHNPYQRSPILCCENLIIVTAFIAIVVPLRSSDFSRALSVQLTVHGVFNLRCTECSTFAARGVQLTLHGVFNLRCTAVFLQGILSLGQLSDFDLNL